MISQLDNNSELVAIFDNAPLIMLLVDEDRRVRRANKMALEYTRREHDEILGLRSGEALRCIHADDHPDGCGYGHDCQNCIIKDTVLDTFKTGESHRRVGTLLNVDAEDNAVPLHVLCSTTQISFAGKNLVLVCLEDVTDIKQTEYDLRISEERYALTQRAAKIGSWDWDILTGNLKWTETIEPIFGFGKGEFGATYEAFLECVHPDDRKHVEDSVNDAVQNDVDYSIEHRIIWPDGTIRWVSEMGNVLRDKSGEPSHMMGIVQDITDRKKVDQLKDEFIGLVSHELRSPLTVIIGAVNTVLGEWDQLSPDEMKNLIQDASLEAENLSHLIGNLVELSRSQANRLIIYPEPADILNIIELAVDSIKRQYPSCQFVLDIPPDIPSVRADQLRIERISYNLLENAAKYSPENSEIKVTARLDGDYVVIGVSDQGDGISLDQQEAIFDSFRRLKKHETSGITGSGLGLSVCRVLVEAHGGSIWIESESGCGSTFYFSLPW